MAKGVPKKKTMNCSLCDTKIRIYKNGKLLPFKDRMAKLRRHRKKKHPKAHKKSIRKAQRTKKERGNPCK